MRYQPTLCIIYLFFGVGEKRRVCLIYNVISDISMKCHLCLEHRNLIKAHIIPESFFLPLKSGKRVPEIHSNIEGQYPKKTPTGIYDTSILCSKCDNAIGVWDNYAQQLLLKDFGEHLAVYHGSRKVAYRIDAFDYEKLKLFFISLLWRASISSQYFYKRVSLGPYERVLREMILKNDPGAPEDFPIVIAKFSDPIVTGMLDPHKDNFEGINFYRFYMTGFVIYIKVDKGKMPEFLEPLYIRKGEPIWIILRDLDKSKDGKIMKDIAITDLR